MFQEVTPARLEAQSIPCESNALIRQSGVDPGLNKLYYSIPYFKCKLLSAYNIRVIGYKDNHPKTKLTYSFLIQYSLSMYMSIRNNVFFIENDAKKPNQQYASPPLSRVY